MELTLTCYANVGQNYCTVYALSSKPQNLIDSISVCTDGSNNLLNGSSPSEDSVRVCYTNRPNKLDAMVVCRDLNLNCR